MREKLFLLFLFNDHDSAGGFNDFHTSSDTVSGLEKIVVDLEHAEDNYQIVDMQSLEIVEADTTRTLKDIHRGLET